MIKFNYQTKYVLKNTKEIKNWISHTIFNLKKNVGDINYVFCDNEFITDINKKFLNHDYPTDIITFDYSDTKIINGEIYLSIEQIKENHKTYNTNLTDELHRVIIHGILHLLGYKDKTKTEQLEMRTQEDYYLSLRTFR
jgi:rRNA maturation RNase YbeY